MFKDMKDPHHRRSNKTQVERQLWWLYILLTTGLLMIGLIVTWVAIKAGLIPGM
jgi:hypothetical protein